jgi:hypothetical protein
MCSLEVGEGGMVTEYSNQVRGLEEILSPLFEGFNNSEQFLVMSVVISLGFVKGM